MEQRQRIYHMDAVRCFCMLYGLLVHGATIGQTPVMELIKSSSEMFRMAAFFLVSGFFTAMVCARTELGDFVRNRGRLVLVPLAAGLVLLNPVTNWLVQWFHGGGIGFVEWFRGGWRQPVPGPGIWHLHLWFLFSLFAYAMVTPLLLSLARSDLVTRALGWWMDRTGPLAVSGLALAMGVFAMLMRGFDDALVAPLTPAPFAYVVQATLGNFVFFAMGLLAFAQRRLFAAMHERVWIGLLLFGAAYAAQRMAADGLPPGIERATFWVVKVAFMFAIVCAMLAIGRRLVTKGSPLLSALTDGVYSFYIFHYLLIYAVGCLVQLVTPNVSIIYVVIMVVGYPLLFWWHRRVIVPSPILTWLFNGKIVKREPVAA